MRITEVIVSPQGEATIQTKGYTGAECQEATKFLEQALGVVSSDRKTPEFFNEIPAHQQQENRA